MQWPTGIGGKGNEGVSAFVQRISGAIGYVEYAYAKQNNLTYVMLQNRDGAFVGPNEASFKAEWGKVVSNCGGCHKAYRKPKS